MVKPSPLMSFFIWLSVFSACLAITVQASGGRRLLDGICLSFVTGGGAAGAIIGRPIAGMTAGVILLAIAFLLYCAAQYY